MLGMILTIYHSGCHKQAFRYVIDTNVRGKLLTMYQWMSYRQAFKHNVVVNVRGKNLKPFIIGKLLSIHLSTTEAY